MLDLIGNYKAAFSHDAAHIGLCNDTRRGSSVVSVSASYASGSDLVLESTTLIRLFRWRRLFDGIIDFVCCFSYSRGHKLVTSRGHFRTKVT